MLGPVDVGGIGALDSAWLASLKARDGYERLPRPNRFLLVYPWFDVNLESELVSSGEGLIPALSRTGRPTGGSGSDTGESRVTGAP